MDSLNDVQRESYSFIKCLLGWNEFIFFMLIITLGSVVTWKENNRKIERNVSFGE